MSGCSQSRRLPGLCLEVRQLPGVGKGTQTVAQWQLGEPCLLIYWTHAHSRSPMLQEQGDTHRCLAHSMPAPTFHNAKFFGICIAALQANTFLILACTSQEGWKLTPSDGKPSEFYTLVTPRLHFSMNSAAWWWPGRVTWSGGCLPTSSAGHLLMSPGQLRCQAPPPCCHDALWQLRLTELLKHLRAWI